jgi:hypothetical protein
MKKHPRIDFDLPTKHTDATYDFVPNKSRDPAEIARRKKLRPGTLKLEEQLRGTEIARRLLAGSVTSTDRKSSAHLIALAGINSSWLTHARDAEDVMRRRQKLAQLVHPETSHRRTIAELRSQTLLGYAGAVLLAGTLTAEHAAGRPTRRSTSAYGRTIGNLSIQSAVLGHDEFSHIGSEVEVQDRVCEISLDTLQQAREIGREVGANPSLAQLPDPFSPYGIYIRETASDGTYQLYQSAVEDITRSGFGKIVR